MSTGIAIDIDYDLFDKIIAGFDFAGKDKMLNHYEVCKRVYESSYMYMKFAVVEEKTLREKYEKTIVEKVKLTGELEAKIKAYEKIYGTLERSAVPEEGEGETVKPANVLSLHQGGKNDSGNTGPSGVS